MEEQYPNLKGEVQTPQGFLKELKKEKMPDTQEMPQKALERYEEMNGELTPDFVKKNFNRLLQRMIEIEKELYEEYEHKVTAEAPSIFIEEHYQQDEEYPEIQQLISDVKQIYESEDSFEEAFKRIFPKVYPMADLISQSASQGRKNRAGKSFERHVENLVKKMGYDFDRQEEVDGAVIDIVIPDMDTFNNNPDYTIFLACQTTLKDRFRLSLSKVTRDRVRTFIATGTGHNVITDNDGGDLTEKKVNEIHDKGYRILVFDEVKEDKFPDNNTVMSYSEFAQEELPNIAERWS